MKATQHTFPKPHLFWPKVLVARPDDCWLWTGAIDSKGYGSVSRWIDGKKWKYGAHRAAYLDRVGPIPEGLELDHLCRNPPCVNPAHLEPVTHAENMRRMIPARGKRHPQRTLDADGNLICGRGHVVPLEGGNYRNGTRNWPNCRQCAADYARAYRRRLSEEAA